MKKGYEFIRLDQIRLLLDYESKSRKKYVLLSCDDGWQKNLQLVPLLEKYQIPLLLFVATQPIREGNFWWETVLSGPGSLKERAELLSQFKRYSYERFRTDLEKLKESVSLERSALTSDQLKELAANPLITIGAHTVSHPILPNCPEKVQENEIRQSKEQLEAWLGKKIIAFSYPNSSYNDTTVRLVKEAGFQYAFTAKDTYLKSHQTDPFLIPRFFLNPYGGFYENRARITGSWYWMKRIILTIYHRDRS
ncbi:MAG: polysaccharide deacetylase family protein [Bacteroidota bacterium]|nr:polysaccharide deacetylase family protein [Bacteroidota bacterium]